MILYVHGNPAPQGSKRYLGTTKMGRGIVVETSDKTKPWRADIIAACHAYREKYPEDALPLEGPVMGRMSFNFRRPASVSRKKRPFMDVAPDLDKLVRGVLDPLQIGGLLVDDKQIVDLRASKHYCNDPGSTLSTPGLFLILMRVEPDLEIGAQ